MKKLLLAIVFIVVLVATAASVNLTKVDTLRDTSTAVADTVVVRNDSLFADSLALSLNKIPKAQQLYTVAKKELGKWARLFVIVKIEESGADGKNSFYAKEYNNLTGMRFPGSKRKTTAVAMGKSYYAIFNHWYDCMKDFGLYMEMMENHFIEKHKRAPKDDIEMINHMHGSYNKYSKWHKDMLWLQRNIKLK